jgi:hypothetical protein
MTDTPNTEELIARLEHAAMGFAQDRSEHTERRLNAARKILIDAQAAELARRDEVISLKNRNIEDLLEQLARLRAERVPEGWRIERKDNKPFKNIEVTAPNGYTALVGSIDRNPSIVLYMLAEALLSPPPPAQPAPPSAVERDAVRLDWLMRHVPGRALRPLIGVMAWSGDIDEFRAAIDAAAGKEKP